MLKGSELELWFAGPISPELSAIVSAQRDPRITFLGPIPRNELSAIYSRASVMVLPSIEEGLALVQAQAIACGVPVVATPNAGAEDLFIHGRHGFIVPPRSPESIAAVLDLLYREPGLLTEMKRNCLALAQDLGGWAAYGERAMNHYRALLQ